MLQWLPGHKGLVNGIVVAGFGGGALIFNLVQTAYINPLNKTPDLPAYPGSREMYVHTCAVQQFIIINTELGTKAELLHIHRNSK